MSTRSTGRLDSYKSKGLMQPDDLRRRREDQQVEIRRQKRDETHAKRRQMDYSKIDLTDDDDSDEEAVGSLIESGKVRLFVCWTA